MPVGQARLVQSKEQTPRAPSSAHRPLRQRSFCGSPVPPRQAAPSSPGKPVKTGPLPALGRARRGQRPAALSGRAVAVVVAAAEAVSAAPGGAVGPGVRRVRAQAQVGAERVLRAGGAGPAGPGAQAPGKGAGALGGEAAQTGQARLALAFEVAGAAQGVGRDHHEGLARLHGQGRRPEQAHVVALGQGIGVGGERFERLGEVAEVPEEPGHHARGDGDEGQGQGRGTPALGNAGVEDGAAHHGEVHGEHHGAAVAFAGIGGRADRRQRHRPPWAGPGEHEADNAPSRASAAGAAQRRMDPIIVPGKRADVKHKGSPVG